MLGKDMTPGLSVEVRQSTRGYYADMTNTGYVIVKVGVSEGHWSLPEQHHTVTLVTKDGVTLTGEHNTRLSSGNKVLVAHRKGTTLSHFRIVAKGLIVPEGTKAAMDAEKKQQEDDRLAYAREQAAKAQESLQYAMDVLTPEAVCEAMGGAIYMEEVFEAPRIYNDGSFGMLKYDLLQQVEALYIAARASQGFYPELEPDEKKRLAKLTRTVSA